MQVRPVILQSDDQLVGLLRGRRAALGLSQGDLEHRVGWLDSYCAKLEAPHRNYGKRIASLFTHALFDWLTGLGLTLVLMDAEQAEQLAAASTAPALDQARPAARAKFDAKRPAVVVTEMRTRVRVVA